MLKGFTLIDVLIGVTLTSFLVFFVASFIRETMLYSTFVARHQQIRQETFALVNNAIAGLVREAVAIDYAESTSERLALFMDKFESPSKRISIVLVGDEADEDDELEEEWGLKTSDEKRSQLVILREKEPPIFLNSPRTYITSFDFEYPQNPRTASDLADARALQPLVRVKLSSRFQRPTDDDPGLLSFLEDPRVSYQAAYALRNYSLSNLR